MKIKCLHIIFITLLLTFTHTEQSKTESNAKLLTYKTDYTAGSNIRLEFTNLNNTKTLLYCNSSYGVTLVSPQAKNQNIVYDIPQSISDKIGKVSWKLIGGDTSINGEFYIKPLKEVSAMETYIGPPSIEAGGNDFSMLVVIPTDRLDNPLAEQTPVIIKHQFLDNEWNDKVVTKNLLTYKKIYSPKQNGRILVSSECLNLNSKEFTINVFPSAPSNFKISAKRPHSYADGNQITSFETSIIKDKNDNVVVDGTYVDFFITNSKGHLLKTSGTTIKGIATAKMIHPNYKTEWSIKAYINGMAESDIIHLKYNRVIEDFDIKFSENNREINIGPLKSFMNQMIPDGLDVKLSIYKNDTLIHEYIKSSYNGFVKFKLNSDIIKKDNYNLVILAAGIEKIYENTTL